MAPKAKCLVPESTQTSPQKRNGQRSQSPTKHCLRQPGSPQKSKRRVKSKAPATQEEIATQIAARIAQLSAGPAETQQQPSVKVKSIAELRSTKIARLTTKIAVNEAEIARLEREYAAAKERLDRETVALETRREALTTVASSTNSLAASNGASDPKTKATLQLMDDARMKLEQVADRAQDLLIRFRAGEITEHSTMRELKNLLEGAKDGGCDVAGLCEMVAALDFTGATPTDTASAAEVRTARKRKVQDMREGEQDPKPGEHDKADGKGQVEDAAEPPNLDSVEVEAKASVIAIGR